MYFFLWLFLKLLIFCVQALNKIKKSYQERNYTSRIQDNTSFRKLWAYYNRRKAFITRTRIVLVTRIVTECSSWNNEDLNFLNTDWTTCRGSKILVFYAEYWNTHSLGRWKALRESLTQPMLNCLFWNFRKGEICSSVLLSPGYSIDI